MAANKLAKKAAENSLRLAEEYLELARYDFHVEITREKAEKVINLAETLVRVLSKVVGMILIRQTEVKGKWQSILHLNTG